ncbi:uncharacterized protein At1g65710-like [Herrania umbratica]|uniref:Uncharacterized protein At1g65710-like n=1 Tax=Herrania umbratica TaxID=108875 RepID=A0A6J1BEV1_9ROSI|nr:uncharacterized protein At1g65710-like [Herrania umbratica]
MGTCFSKKRASSSNHSQPQPASHLPVPVSSAPLAADTALNNNSSHHSLNAGSDLKIYQVAEGEQVGKASQEEDSLVKKEVFVIKHRKSHDRDRRSPPPQKAAPHSTENESASSVSDEGGICNINTAVRTSSCTKEEVDAILIQCGRLSRSNSSGKTASSSRKYSGSKRSYDFDNENDNDHIGVASADYGSRKKGNDGFCDDDRPRHRQSSRSSSSQGRRRTPSREREQHQQRSGSRERGTSSGGRRVSRSPGRRSENTQGSLGSNAANATNRPGKMVSVPATVSSLVMDKSTIGAAGVEAATTTANAIKRISVKRNVGEAAVGSRGAASPRSQSPARPNPNANNAKGCNENQLQPTLSRSSSRKAEHSPYRRNPLSEIDPNSLAYPQSAANKTSTCINKGQGGLKEYTNVINQKLNAEMSHKVIVQGANKAGSIGTADNKVANVNSTAKEQRMVEEVKTEPPMAGAENPKPQTLTRSRSSRRSRDLDLNPETLLNPIPSSYTTLLLEDIQNFHQTNNPPSFSLPSCVSKACSILEAVADLNSTTSSNLSCAFSEDRKGLSTDESSKNGYNATVGRKMAETRDPFVESEVVGGDDLMEPSFHKYVTVRRGGTLGGTDMEEQESSGSNSFVGSGQQQHWGFSSSSWEPNSADSTDRWTSRTKSREEDHSSSLELQRQAVAEPESGSDIKNSTRKGLSGRRKDADLQHVGIGRAGKIGAGKGLHPVAAST